MDSHDSLLWLTIATLFFGRAAGSALMKWRSSLRGWMKARLPERLGDVVGGGKRRLVRLAVRLESWRLGSCMTDFFLGGEAMASEEEYGRLMSVSTVLNTVSELLPPSEDRVEVRVWNTSASTLWLRLGPEDVASQTVMSVPLLGSNGPLILTGRLATRRLTSICAASLIVGMIVKYRGRDDASSPAVPVAASGRGGS